MGKSLHLTSGAEESGWGNGVSEDLRKRVDELPPKAVGHESKRGVGWREGQREGAKGTMGGQGKTRNKNVCMEMP